LKKAQKKHTKTICANALFGPKSGQSVVQRLYIFLKS